MPCRPKLGPAPNFAMQGCEPGCDPVFKKKQHGPGFDPVQLICMNVTRAGVSGGELILGEQKCVCVLPCPTDGDDACKMDKGFKKDGSIDSITCKGTCCKTFFETPNENDPAHGECWLIVDHSIGEVLKCVCVWITKAELAKRKKDADDKKQKEDQEKADKEELQKLKKELEKTKDDLQKEKAKNPK